LEAKPGPAVWGVASQPLLASARPQQFAERLSPEIFREIERRLPCETRCARTPDPGVGAGVDEELCDRSAASAGLLAAFRDQHFRGYGERDHLGVVPNLPVCRR